MYFVRVYVIKKRYFRYDSRIVYVKGRGKKERRGDRRGRIKLERSFEGWFRYRGIGIIWFFVVEGEKNFYLYL